MFDDEPERPGHVCMTEEKHTAEDLNPQEEKDEEQQAPARSSGEFAPVRMSSPVMFS